MIENILWLSIGLMVTSSAVPRKFRIRKLVGGIGWGTFSIYWSYQPFYYLKVLDYVNVLLSIVVTLFCIFVAIIMFHEYREGHLCLLNNRQILQSKYSTLDKVDFRNVTSMLTSACALGALVYFPFANSPYLNTWIIGGVTSQVVWILQYFDIPAYMEDWNLITLNGHTVRIILACTAIESMALFMGLICAVRAPLSRLATAFVVSVPVIYVLNLIRDIFVVVAYGEQWFGVNSFIIAHNYIAKLGSVMALFIISYAVLRILPELLEMIDALLVILSEELKSLVKLHGGD